MEQLKTYGPWLLLGLSAVLLARWLVGGGGSLRLALAVAVAGAVWAIWQLGLSGMLARAGELIEKAARAIAEAAAWASERLLNALASAADVVAAILRGAVGLSGQGSQWDAATGGELVAQGGAGVGAGALGLGTGPRLAIADLVGAVSFPAGAGGAAGAAAQFGAWRAATAQGWADLAAGNAAGDGVSGGQGWGEAEGPGGGLAGDEDEGEPGWPVAVVFFGDVVEVNGQRMTWPDAVAYISANRQHFTEFLVDTTDGTAAAVEGFLANLAAAGAVTP